MKQIAIIFLALTIILSCKQNTSQPHAETEIMEVPSEVYKLPLRKNIEFNSNNSFTIDLKDINDSVTWIYTQDLNECFCYGTNHGELSINSKGKLQSAKLFINYLPTIWADENDKVLQFIQFTPLVNVGKKTIRTDSKQTLLLHYNDLRSLPENVQSYMSGITKEDLLIALENCGNDFECDNWKKEEPIWKRYISKYQPGIFLEKENNKFGVYPSTFVLQLTIKSKKGFHVVNLCDNVIIGN